MFQLTDPPGNAAQTVPGSSLPSGGYDDPLSPGQVLAGRFRIVRRIAVGGMGVVYEATDEKLRRRIALKCARSGRGTLLSPEVRLATELSHPNLCKIYEIHTADSKSGSIDFFTMEFLEGETLSARLQRGTPDVQEARDIALQLCAGLAESHRNRIIHGDLKSANVILSRRADGGLRAVITDFGLARADGDSGFRGGTPAYMAPELRAGGPNTVLTDIYALGVILHELACGFRPDQRGALAPTSTVSDSARPRRRVRIFARTPRHPDPGARWQGILKQTLHADPRERFQTVEDVIRALGPSVVRRRLLTGLIALSVATASAGVAWRISTAPPESVHLGIDASAAGPIAGDLYTQIGRLQGNERLGFSVSRKPDSSASHLLRITATSGASGPTVHVLLSDLKSEAPVTEWSMNYRRDELRYAPVAIAGVVSAAFHLAPVVDCMNTGPSAAPVWRDGFALSRDDRRLDDAAALLQKAAVLDPGSALVHASLAEVEYRRYFLTRDKAWRESAFEWLRQAELRNSDCAAVHSIAGLLEADRGRRETGLIRLRRATELPSVSSDGWRRLAGIYRQNGQYHEALHAFRKAVEIEPQFFRNYQELGTLQRDMADHEDAARMFEDAIRLAPAPISRLHAALASSYQNVGRFPEAENQLLAALRVSPEAPPYMELGHLLMYQKRLPEAQAWLVKALDHDARDYLAGMYLGLALEWMGRRPEAAVAFRTALRTVEEEVSSNARDGKRRAFLAYLCARTGQPHRAESEIAQALQLTPSKSDTIWMAALTWEALGNRRAALDALSNAPLTLLLDLQRWPEASELTTDAAFLQIIAAARTKAAQQAPQ